MLMVAVVNALQTWSFLKAARAAPGEVIRLDHGYYHSTVEFTGTDGKKHQYAQNGFCALRKGEKVKVLYLPSDPQKASVDRFGAIWGSTLLIGLIACGHLAAARKYA